MDSTYTRRVANGSEGTTGGRGQDGFSVSPPTVALPKGGGAIRSIAEKFGTNSVTGTGSMRVPITTALGRGGFVPDLSIAYDSGAGNGPFGLGWSLSIPSITRKTDRGLPVYDDENEADVFVLSGAEDLVPLLEPGGRRHEDRHTVPGYVIRRYRPRIEGLFARIERWTRLSDGDAHWRSISKDNVLTIYGEDDGSRVADPEAPWRVFSWLICQTRDDKGNAVLYDYKREDGAGVDLARPNERNRGDRDDRCRTANRYLKRIRHGNRKPVVDDAGRRPRTLDEAQLREVGWMFEIVLDYGEHDPDRPTPGETQPWEYRADPFSSYRAGFEVRTTRLCRRVLMFHHFAEAEDVGEDCLVRSTDFAHSEGTAASAARGPLYTFLRSVSQTGYRRSGAGYEKRSLPPAQFEYSAPVVHSEVEEVSSATIDNLPVGVDGVTYQWTDLHGEGAPGILTEQGEAWFYRRNLSPASDGAVVFAPLERVGVKPNISIAGSRAQFMDLAGDGLPDLVVLDGLTPGFYEHDDEEAWKPFRSFLSRLNRDTRDANLRLVDLDGDGRADVLITEDDAFVWHRSLGEDGFAPARRLAQARDEEKGPRVVFADRTQSIHLADLSGDGLADLVRVRNGEICYWPNLGYGRFGRKVSMDRAPRFESPDQFDPRRIKLADIDGSGTTDVIYLHREGVRLYFNQSGNAWSEPVTLEVFPHVGDVTTVAVTDLRGNGTACLVWSSPLPGHARRPIRYVDLMGGQKPHLLIKTVNNLGAETLVSYAPSTKFYLADKQAGKPWIRKLPFPVHCVEKVTVTDKWRGTAFSSTYSYHHGYFDSVEREFRGFGRVEALDVESYGEFAQGNVASPYITDDTALYQPPVKTVTWYHTGAPVAGGILSQFAHEYFPRWFEDAHPDVPNVLGDFHELVLPEPELTGENLTGDEWREALRACKGMTLRQETYELDVDALERGVHEPVRLFSAACHNCHVRRVQPKGNNQHAVFLVAESEALTYHYELDLRPQSLSPDPRIAHTLNLRFDEYANVLQSVVVVYPRHGRFEDGSLRADELAAIHQVQTETHLAYTETRYTNDVEDPDTRRLRVPFEVLTCELTGMAPQRNGRYFTLDDLRRFRLSPAHDHAGEWVPEIPYFELPNRTSPQKRLVEHVRMLFFDNDAAALNDPLPLGRLGRLGLLYETYKLGLTDDLLDWVIADKLTPELRRHLADGSISGYLSGAPLAARFPGTKTAGQYWLRSGIAGFAPDAAQHFYLPERYSDGFGNVTTVEYDPLDLFVASSTDAVGNTTRVARFDFRVLSPSAMYDENDNVSEVAFDVLGSLTALALRGKGNEGDNLVGFDGERTDPPLAELNAFFTGPDYDEATARRWLGNATARYVYYLGETRDPHGAIVWGSHPACACGTLREKHVAELASGEESVLHTSFQYSDGLGSVVVKKVQAEPEAPGQPLRWVASGKTILNDKGKPVKQYEPYFSPSGHRFEEPIEVGVTPVNYYDALGRSVRIELPDGSFSRVEFSPWHVASYDPNDTAYDPDVARQSDWYKRRTDSTHPQFAAFHGPDDSRAARLVAVHAGTPTLTLLDSQGRDVAVIVHNRVKNALDVLVDEKYVTFTKLDAEGKPLWLRDARKNLVMQYIAPPVADGQPDDPLTGFAPAYDIAGNLLFQHSMDAGDRWMLNDAAGKPLLAWDNRGQAFRTTYDALRRPIAFFVTGADLQDATREVLFETVTHGDSPDSGLSDVRTKQLNLRGKTFQHRDMAGIVTNTGRDEAGGVDEAFDFKGNLLRSSRQLVRTYTTIPDWSGSPELEAETFTTSSRYDALNRPVSITAPDGSIYRPTFNRSKLLATIDVNLGGAAAATLFVSNIDYNAKGQRTSIEYGNGASTTYQYDPLTFRLAHMVTVRPTGAVTEDVQNLRYAYDPVGNVLRIRDEAQPTIFFDNQKISPSADYEYDATYRLTAATGREHIGQHAPPQVDESDAPRQNHPLPTDGAAMRRYREQYEYDPAGNILRVIHQAAGNGSWTRRYAYEAASNRLRATSLPGDEDGAFSADYVHDAHGNITAMPHLPLMRWDFEDRLAATSRQVVNRGTAEITYYSYDAAGQRTRKVTERQAGVGQTTSRHKEHIYLGGFEIDREFDSDGATIILERTTVHVLDDNRRVALIETRTDGEDGSPRQLVRYQHANHLGSASVELDDQARVISYEEYYPYGSTSYQGVSKSIAAAAKRYRYAEMERDVETGFNYHAARYYAPWLGRWTRPDPIGIEGGLNQYAYAASNPIHLTDVSGHQPTPPPPPQGGVLMDLWRYGADLANRAALGRNIQLDHPIQVAGRIAQRTTDSGVALYSRAISKAEGELTVIVETGKGLFHTELGKLQAPIRTAMKSGALSSESEIVALTKAAYARASSITGAVVNELALDTAILSNQATIHTSLSNTVQELRAATAGATTIGNVSADVDAAFEATAQLAPKAAEAATVATKSAGVLAKLAPVAKALAPAARFLGRIAGPLGIGIGAFQIATAKDTEGQIDGGITVVSSALLMSPHPVAKAAGGGLAAGQIIEKTLDVSHYSSSAGMFVNEGLQDLGANETASLVAGGVVTVLATPAAITVAAADKGYKLAGKGYDYITDKVGYELCVPFYNCD